MASSVERVELPGIGFRSIFSTSEGIDVGVLEHNSPLITRFAATATAQRPPVRPPLESVPADGVARAA